MEYVTFIYIGCNDAFAKKFVGRAKKDIIGHSDYDLFPKELADLFRSNDIKVLKSLKTHSNYEWVKYTDGRDVYLLTQKFPLCNKEGILFDLTGISRDLTDQKRLMEELRKREVALSQTISVCGDTFDKVVQKGDLSARADVSKLSGKHKQIGEDINKIIKSMQNKIEELRKREEENANAISAFSKVLGKTATGDLSARVNTKGWSEELATIGMAINTLIETLEIEKKQKS